MGSMAVISVTGNVGSDPEIRKTNSGEVCSFTVAVNRKRGQEEFTDWYRCVTFYDKLIDTIDKYVKRGSKVSLYGEPGHQKWEDRDGNEKVTFEILIAKLDLNDLRPPGDNGGPRVDRERGRDDRGRDDRGRDDRGRDDDRGRRDDRDGNGRDDRGTRGPRDDRGGGRGDARASGRDARDDRTRGASRDETPRGGGSGRGGAARDAPKHSDNDLDDEIPF